MEGVNGLPRSVPNFGRPDAHHGATAKNGGARVFVGSMIPQVAGRPRATTPASELLAYNNDAADMSTQEGVTFVDLL